MSIGSLQINIDFMAATRSILLYAAIVVMTHQLPNVRADCRSDIANITAQPVLTIQENSLAGTIILPVTTDYNNLHSAIISGIGGFVTVTNGNIVIATNVSLDGPQNQDACDKSRQTQPMWQIYCNSDTSATKVITVLINFTDDFGPYFTAYETNVSEYAAVGSSVINLGTIVRDDDCTTTFNYYIDDKSKQVFKVSTNNLILDQTLDYERQKEYYINLTVMSSIENGPGNIPNSTILTVYVLDVDDMNPIFDVTQVLLRVPEAQDFSSIWFTATPPIQARDGDVGINTTLTYSLQSVTPNLSLLINNETGQVKILEQLDREHIPAYTVIVKAAQVDAAYKTATATLSLQVADVNDNRPVFVPQSTVTIMEDAPDGSYVTELTGDDLDEGENSLFDFIYTTDSVGAFKIQIQQTTNRTVLVVRNSTALRGQAQAVVEFYLKERLPIVGPPCSNSTTCAGRVTIDITDVNDNTPAFNSTDYTFTMPSNTSGHYVIGQVFANDADRGNNADVKYNFTLVTGPPDCSKITVDPTSGVLATDQQLPPGATCSWFLTACDSPTDPHTRRCSSVRTSVAVVSSGNILELNATVPENVPLGTVLTTLPVTGLNTTSTDFEIKDALLVTRVDMDREARDFYSVPVFSKQSVTSPVMIINVTVTDVNDNTPVFTASSYNFSMSSNVSSPYTLGHVNATDLDSADNAVVVYTLTSFPGPVECSSFHLHPNTGELTLVKPLTAGVVCPLMATACDSPADISLRRCSSVPMTVTVTQPGNGVVEYINVTIQENVPLGTLVYVLPMSGLDTTSTDFEVKDNTLVTKVDIDRERTDSYLVSIVPKQSTNSPVMIINVTIADVNDNPPIFTNQSYLYVQASNASSTSVIGNVAATDLDIGDNGRVQYNLTSLSGPDECSRVTLEPTTGQLKTSQQLAAGIVCSWLVVACDSPIVVTSRRCSSVPLTISVIPAGNVVENTVTIPENVPVGIMVKSLPIRGLQTTSTDFEIRADVLYTNVPLDREQKDHYEVPIISGQNGNSVVMIVYVNVTDVNDNPPKFGQSVYVINMDSSWKINQTLLQVNATDADIGMNAQLTFSMTTGREYFDIDPTTGQIRLANFPPTNGSEYQLLVTDSGQPPYSSIATLKVYSPVYDETATVLLPVSRDELLANRDEVAKNLGTILGVSVRIYNIESLGPAPGVGSKVYISATSAQGRPISPTELNSLLETHANEIYNKFAKTKQSSESSNNNGLSVLEIVLICLASLLLLLVLLAGFLWYRSNKKLRQSRRLFDSLNKDTTIYDNPRKPSSSAAAISSSNNNSTNAQRMLARLSSGSLGNSSVTNLLSAQGDGNNSEGVTPPGSNGSQRRQQRHDYENTLLSPTSNPIISNDGAGDTSPVETNQEQITTFSSQMPDEDVTTRIYPDISTIDSESNQRSFAPQQAWTAGDDFSGRRNSDVDSGTISDKETQLEDADEDDEEVANILSDPHPLTHSHEDTTESTRNRSNLDLMTTTGPQLDVHPGGTDNPVYLDTENPDSSIPPEPEPDYAKKVRFSEATATIDSSEPIISPDSDDKEASLARFLNQYGGAENLTIDADTTQDSLEEMTAL